MKFLKNFCRRKCYISLISVFVLVICGCTIISKATSQKYSRPVEVKKYTVSKLEEENKEDEIIVVENVQANFVVSDNSDEEEEKMKKVEVPKLVVAKVNDSEDKQNQYKDSSTSGASSVSIEETLELYENTGNSVGIDVSKWQGKINWAEVKNSGVDFAMIRIGYRGSSQGNVVMDPYFVQNITGATSNGIKVGVYFFSMARDEDEARQEAAWVVQNVGKYRITYPIAYDFESWGTGRVSDVSEGQIQKNALAFLSYIRASGYSGMMYGSKNALLNRFSMSAFSNYKVWLAHYTEKTNYSGRYNMWQYTDKGSVPGISGNVDMNIAYFSYSNEKPAAKPEEEEKPEEKPVTNPEEKPVQPTNPVIPPANGNNTNSENANNVENGNTSEDNNQDENIDNGNAGETGNEDNSNGNSNNENPNSQLDGNASSDSNSSEGNTQTPNETE